MTSEDVLIVRPISGRCASKARTAPAVLKKLTRERVGKNAFVRLINVNASEQAARMQCVSVDFDSENGLYNFWAMGADNFTAM